MVTLFRWTLRLFLLAMVLAGGGLALAWYLAARSLPDYEASVTVTGLSAPAEILRDRNAIPYISGESDADVFFGLGFAQAQDRLWQMMLLRRTAQGRLSELFGARTLRTDMLMRRLGLYALARDSVADQDDATRAALEAYADGVNARIRQVNENSLGRGAPEFFLFSPEIAPWTPADSLAVGKLIGLRLSDAIGREVRRARLSRVLPAARVRDLMPIGGPALAALPDYARLMEDAPLRTAAREAPPPPPALSPLPAPGMAGASNAFAAAPARTASGGALMANDPHLGFSAPGIWYLAGLDLSAGAVIGATIPGSPAVLMGRSRKLAWGFTATGLDDADILIERLAPDAPGSYIAPDGPRPFETTRSVIRVRGQEPVTITLRRTESGPVMSGREFGLGAVTPEGHVAALQWTLLSGNDTTASAAMGIMRAGSIEAAVAAGEKWVAPAQNMMLAEQGRIALQVVGRIPRRDAGHETRGVMPAPGWTQQNLWLGTFGYEANPRFTDPEGGILVNTNNAVVDRPFPAHLSFDWGDSQRIRRLTGLMQERRTQSRQSFIAAQLDTVSYTARALLPLIARDLWYQDSAAPPGTPERRRQRALDMLADWNGEMSEHLPEPLIYAAWMQALQQRLIGDELGGLAQAFARPEPLFIEKVFRDTDGAGAWCDIAPSTRTESCADIAAAALDEALEALSERYGPQIASWRWGAAHVARQDHPVLGEAPLLSWLVNIRQPTPGGDNTLNRGLTAGRGPAPFANLHGPGFRAVYDMADPERSLFIISTGQSGHPLSGHYADQAALWQRGEYLPMTLSREQARAGAEGITRLVPAR